MGLFSFIGETIGEVIAVPFTITKGVVDGVNKAIDEITED